MSYHYNNMTKQEAYELGIKLAVEMTAYQAGQQPIPANPYRQAHPLAWRVQSYFSRPDVQASISRGFRRAGQVAQQSFGPGGATVYTQTPQEYEEAGRRAAEQEKQQLQRARQPQQQAQPQPRPQPQPQQQPQQYPGMRSVAPTAAPAAAPTPAPAPQQEVAKATPAKAETPMSQEQALQTLQEIQPMKTPKLKEPTSGSSVRG
jgi:hypothetical protein